MLEQRDRGVFRSGMFCTLQGGGKRRHLALAWLQLRGLCIVSNPDDWLLCAETRDDALGETSVILKHLSYFGFLLHFQLRKVLSASPVEPFPLVGLYLESQAMKAHL